MKFFSKITFICNLSFLVFIALSFIELSNKKASSAYGILPLPFITGSLVILGQFAIFLNLIFNLITAVFFIFKKQLAIAQWLLIVNFLFLLMQLYYFLIY